MVAAGSKPTQNKAAWCLLIDNRQPAKDRSHWSHRTSQKVTTRDMHGLRGKPRSIEQYGDITRVPDGWDQPDRMVNPTRLVPQGGENKHQDLFAGPICLRCGAVILAACFRPEKVSSWILNEAISRVSGAGPQLLNSLVSFFALVFCTLHAHHVSISYFFISFLPSWGLLCPVASLQRSNRPEK